MQFQGEYISFWGVNSNSYVQFVLSLATDDNNKTKNINPIYTVQFSQTPEDEVLSLKNKKIFNLWCKAKCESSLWVLWVQVSQRQVAANS